MTCFRATAIAGESIPDWTIKALALILDADGQLFVGVNEERHLLFGVSLLNVTFECKIVHGPSTLFERNSADLLSRDSKSGLCKVHVYLALCGRFEH